MDIISGTANEAGDVAMQQPQIVYVQPVHQRSSNTWSLGGITFLSGFSYYMISSIQDLSLMNLKEDVQRYALYACGWGLAATCAGALWDPYSYYCVLLYIGYRIYEQLRSRAS